MRKRANTIKQKHVIICGLIAHLYIAHRLECRENQHESQAEDNHVQKCSIHGYNDCEGNAGYSSNYITYNKALCKNQRRVSHARNLQASWSHTTPLPLADRGHMVQERNTQRNERRRYIATCASPRKSDAQSQSGAIDMYLCSSRSRSIPSRL